MILRNFTVPDGMKESGWQNLPSAFPCFTEYELSSLAEKSFEERLAFFKRAYGEDQDVSGEEESETVSLGEGVFICDMTRGGEKFVRLREGISANVVCAVFTALCDAGAYDDPDLLVDLVVPNDESVLISAVFAMLGGLPIGAVITNGEEDFDCELFSVADIRGENVLQYLYDFFEDLGYAIGEEDGKGILAGEIVYDGFGDTDVVLLCPFGVFTSPVSSCLAYCKKKTESGEEACAYLETALGLTRPKEEEPLSVCRPVSPRKMKELCKMLEKVKLY